MQRLKISREGISLIKSFEGFRSRAVRREDGSWVIGYGHTVSARDGAAVSEADAELLLQYDLIPVAKALNALQRPLNQNQFDALASFAFSVGLERFQASDVVERLVSGEAGQAADAMVRWDEPRPKVAPINRRAAERALFNADPTQPVSLAQVLAAPLPDPAEMAGRPFAETSGAAAAAYVPVEKDGANQRYLAYPAAIVGPLPGLAAPGRSELGDEGSDEGEAVAPFPAAAGATPFEPGISVQTPDADGGSLTVLSPRPTEPETEVDAQTPVDPAEPDPTGGEDNLIAEVRTTIRHEVVAHKPGRQDWREIGLYVVMSAFGLLTFGLAVAAFRRASQPMSGPEFMTISWVLAVFGFGCIAISAWNLYRKLGRSEA